MGFKLFIKVFLLVGMLTISSGDVYSQSQEVSATSSVPEIMTKIKIPSHHFKGICRKDSDCRVVELDCTSVGCSCERGAVHKSLAKSYDKVIKACRKQQLKLKYCDKKCPPVQAYCVTNVCVVAPK